jgi:SAM-dependent methyltransferase
MHDRPPSDPGFADVDRLLDGPDPDEDAWYAAVGERLATAYLATDDPFAQSGMRADAARWERGRRPIVAAIDRDGTFLDVGCANGLLMESVATWAEEAGYRVEPYGLDLSPALAALARRRLPRWGDRVFVGNVVDWQPPRRFDVVRTELVYVPPARQPALVAHLLREVVAPGGRLVVCSYGSSRRPDPRAEPVGDLLRVWGHRVTGESEGADANGVVFVRVAWVDAPSGPPVAAAG